MNSGYKHIYFNLTRNSLIIWTFTILAIILVYEATKYVIHLKSEGMLRTSMFFLLVASLYPNYYSWWSYFNAWNDDFFGQFIHQGIFTVTELVSTFIIAHLCNTKSTVKPIMLLVILNIATLHILASSFDQFITNVLQGEGEWHQLGRDLGFMVFDLFNLVIPLIEMRNYAKNHGIQINQCVSFDELVCSVIFIALLLFVSALLWIKNTDFFYQICIYIFYVFIFIHIFKLCICIFQNLIISNIVNVAKHNHWISLTSTLILLIIRPSLFYLDLHGPPIK